MWVYWRRRASVSGSLIHISTVFRLDSRWEWTNSVLGLYPAIPDRLHDTPLLVRNIPQPIRFPSCDKHMRRPAVDVTVQFLLFIDGELCGIADAAALAVVVAVFPVDTRVDFGEECSFWGFGEAVFDLRDRGRGTFGCEEGFSPS